MPELKAIFSANAEPFKRELRAAQALSVQAGRNIQQNLSGGGLSAHTGSSGILRELLVLTRELANGNITRVPGSLSILLQRMGLLKLIFKDSAGAANVLATAYAELSVQSSAAAVAATRKAAASLSAFYADEAETEATLEQATADEVAAVAARNNAVAIQAKAEAATEAAAAQGGAAAGVGAVGIVAGVVVGLLAGMYAAYKLSGALVERLSGLKFPDFHPEYIAKHLQKVNQAAEGWKEIAKAVDKAVDKYKSAEEGAKRIADATKLQFEHEQKLAELHKERDLANAKTPKAKAAIEAKYDQEELDRNNRERDEQVRNKETEAFNLEQETARKKAVADAINVNSKEHDAELLKKQKGDAEAAQKYLDDNNAAKNSGDLFTRNNLVKGYNSVALSDVSGGDLTAAEKANEAEARRRIKAYQNTVDQTADNDEQRKRKEDLTKDAANSASKAAEIRAGANDDRAKNAQASKDEAEEAKAKQEAEDAKARNSQKGRNALGILTEWQKQGAYTAPGQIQLLDVNRKMENHLRRIDDKMEKIVTNRGKNLGEGGF